MKKGDKKLYVRNTFVIIFLLNLADLENKLMHQIEQNQRYWTSWNEDYQICMYLKDPKVSAARLLYYIYPVLHENSFFPFRFNDRHSYTFYPIIQWSCDYEYEWLKVNSTRRTTHRVIIVTIEIPDCWNLCVPTKTIFLLFL